MESPVHTSHLPTISSTPNTVYARCVGISGKHLICPPIGRTQLRITSSACAGRFCLESQPLGAYRIASGSTYPTNSQPNHHLHQPKESICIGRTGKDESVGNSERFGRLSSSSMDDASGWTLSSRVSGTASPCRIVLEDVHDAGDCRRDHAAADPALLLRCRDHFFRYSCRSLCAGTGDHLRGFHWALAGAGFFC